MIYYYYKIENKLNRKKENIDKKIDENDKNLDIQQTQLENKTDAIVICGTTGEASTLEDEEHLNVRYKTYKS